MRANLRHWARRLATYCRLLMKKRHTGDKSDRRTGVRVKGDARGSEIRDVTIAGFDDGLRVEGDLIDTTLKSIHIHGPDGIKRSSRLPWYQRPLGLLLLGVPLAFIAWGATLAGPFLLKAAGLAVTESAASSPTQTPAIRP